MWQKSAKSMGNGNCIEAQEIAFRKSSYSGNGGNCVEVATVDA